ncbi:MAG: 4-hydroxy-tetrahydrodipicolinate reductase [Bacteroidales bacterium]|nr:4-hydroxy-tetrahydrodipicolinate reductase [Bacteroidales bacterium]MBD5224183.1 4-hydroxy-tetrahydrodipicolinate reductase [Bacteroidales bacterium]MBD5301979.1 4-hydroxy-tetrahydrodipicolinate reductase [Bacteroides sp.]
MKIALIGYGKMGHIIEKIATERGNEITCCIDTHNPEMFESEEFRHSDVAIEFTIPTCAVANMERCFAAGVPVVCGTTGWTAELPRLKALCEQGEGTMMWSSNFSIGVNIFMALNRYLAKIMNSFPGYSPSMTEIHHIHKLDHPSGTAITLAEQLVDCTDRLKDWAEPDANGNVSSAELLPVAHERRGEVPGIHSIKWDSEADDITITHSAKSRAGFALGAVMAAEWLAGKKGWYTIGRMLNERTGLDIF